jgi:hypothetical protein
LHPPTPAPSPREYLVPTKADVTDADIVRNWKVVSDNPKYIEKRVPDHDGIALYRLVKHLQPKGSLEIGYYSGASTIAITSALRDLGQEPARQHLALDLEDWHGGPQNVEAAGLGGYVRFVSGDSSRTMPQLAEEGHNLDFVFIDGNHRFDYCLIDFFYGDRLLRVGGVMGFHDTHADWPAVDKVLAFIDTNRAYESLGLFQGIALYRKLRNDFENGKFDRDAQAMPNF